MVDVDYFKTTRNKGNEIKTIGIYYRSIKNGGAQRVVAALANEWAKMRDAKGDPVYKVVLVTDEETEDGEGIPEYELDYAVVREYIQFANIIKSDTMHGAQLSRNIRLI